MSAPRDHRMGLIATAAGVAVFVPDALSMRLAAMDPFALTAFRGLCGGLVMTLGCLLVFGRGLIPAVRALGGWGLALAALEGVSTLLFVLAVAWTTVANAMLAFAATPLLAALIARLTLGERLAPPTVAAFAALCVGLALVAADAGGTGGTSPIGVAAGLGAALTIAGFFVLLRRLKAASAAPVIGPGWLLGALIALPFADFSDTAPVQYAWAFLSGGVILPLAITLVAWGSRAIPAAEASMLTLFEVAAGPLLVWAVLAEVPGPLTLAGGAVVLSALTAHSLWRLRAAPAALPI